MYKSNLLSIMCTLVGGMCMLLALWPDVLVYEGKIVLAYTGLMFMLMSILVGVIDVLNRKY